MTITAPEVDSGLILRNPPEETLADVLNTWDRKRSRWSGGVHNVSVHLTEDEPTAATIVFGQHEVQATDTGKEALARFLGIPVRFLLSVPADEQQYMFDRRIERSGEQDLVTWFTSDGVDEVLPASKQRIDPIQIAQAVAGIMPIESMVRDAWQNPNDLRLDVFVPEGFDRGWGGDRKVGDITAGGVRVSQNRKQNLAPGVQPIAYRLACTNGMEIEDLGLKIDARGMDVDEVMAEFSIEVERAFSRVEHDIEAFYAMRSQKVADDRTGVLRRVSLDAGLPARVVGILEDLMPTRLSSGTDISMFDLANLITNQANIAPTSGSARRLQQAGGSLVNDHAARCPSCHQHVKH
jgi:hypothetical protein